MSVPFLSPGQTDAGVPRMKKLLVPQLLKLGLTAVAQKIHVDSTTYGPTAEHGVRKFQEAKKLQVDGCVGKNTWAALGVKEPVVGGPQPSKAADVAHGGQVIIAPGANFPNQPDPGDDAGVHRPHGGHRREADHGHHGDEPQEDVGQRQGLRPLHRARRRHRHVRERWLRRQPGRRQIMEAACLAAGDSKEGAKAKARDGGLFNFNINNRGFSASGRPRSEATTTTTCTWASVPREVSRA